MQPITWKQWGIVALVTVVNAALFAWLTAATFDPATATEPPRGPWAFDGAAILVGMVIGLALNGSRRKQRPTPQRIGGVVSALFVLLLLTYVPWQGNAVLSLVRVLIPLAGAGLAAWMLAGTARTTRIHR